MRLRGIGAFGLVVAAALIAAGTWNVLTPTPALEAGARVLDVPANEGVLRIARRLQEAEVIRSRAAFVGLSLVRGSLRSLKAGEYEVPKDATTLDVLGLLESGRVRQHLVLHPEGATVAELARALETTRLALASELVRVAIDPRFVRSLGIDAPSVEGYLFPDTYQFVRGMTPEQILTRMVQRTQAKLTPELRSRARERHLSVNQLLTLASIIEREAVVRDEMSLISAVFWNRLKLDMPLQADPTVQYAHGKERRALSRADLATDHPYNTYRRTGLPPGPIASPGLRAIEAALAPADVKYLYFVTIDGQRHHFSTNVAEHNRFVARYHRTVRNR